MTHAPWWGEVKLPVGAARRWTIGAFDLCIEHRRYEWCIGFKRDLDPLSTRLATFEESSAFREGSETFEFEQMRFGASERSDTLILRPAMADRFIVVRLESILRVPPGEEVTLYASLPVFLQLYLPNASAPLIEWTSFPMTNTWFGPNTMSGKLSYAVKTVGQLDLADVSKAPHRAICAILVKNRDNTALEIERIHIPVHALRLFADAEHDLWADEITMTCQSPTEASVSVTPNKQADPRTEISPAREAPNLIMRALGSLFRRGLS